MLTATTDERRRSFDRMVELYARARPPAPAEVFDALAVYVPSPGDALEIGCGPGNASRPLLERGFRIHAVELGENLAAFARERLAAFPFTVEVGKLEDALLQPASVGLVVCSSAFHWLDRERALRQVVKVLKPGGALALILRYFVLRTQRRLAGFIGHDHGPAPSGPLLELAGEIVDQGARRAALHRHL